MRTTFHATKTRITILHCDSDLHPGVDGEGEGPEHGRGADDEGYPEGQVHPQEHVRAVPEHYEAGAHQPGHGNDSRTLLRVWTSR